MTTPEARARANADKCSFTTEQRWWLDQIAAHIGVNLSVAPDDLAFGDFFNRGGSFAAARTFGAAWPSLLDELNTALVA